MIVNTEIESALEQLLRLPKWSIDNRRTILFCSLYLSRRFGLCTVTSTSIISTPWVIFTQDVYHPDDDPQLLRQILYTIWSDPDLIRVHMARRRCTYLRERKEDSQ